MFQARIVTCGRTPEKVLHLSIIISSEQCSRLQPGFATPVSFKNNWWEIINNAIIKICSNKVVAKDIKKGVIVKQKPLENCKAYVNKKQLALFFESD